jgi:lipopolysaccharide biosynthesis regulator YciM
MFNFSQLPIWTVVAIPVAIFLLWLFFRPTSKSQQSNISSDYFKGLNYLLNDEQGKALDVFVKLVESNWDTIDTHFALGKIYRKNGEMDKAIKIHQGLIARPSLPEQYRNKILLELGYDYLDAGWFDRAEGLFKEVLLQDKTSKQARHNLILIYQQEKDWFKAIDVADDLFSKKSTVIGPMIAQYYCELADISKAKGDARQLEIDAKKALRYDPACVRASILLAEQAKSSGDTKKAIKLYECIEKQDAESMPLVIEAMHDCHCDLSSQKKFLDYLFDLHSRHSSLYLQNITARVIETVQGKEVAIAYLTEKIKQQPNLTGLHALLSYKQKEAGAEQILNDLSVAIKVIQKASSAYRCKKCGFNTNTHYWLCPGCNSWGKVKPNVIEHDEPAV